MKDEKIPFGFGQEVNYIPARCKLNEQYQMHFFVSEL